MYRPEGKKGVSQRYFGGNYTKKKSKSKDLVCMVFFDISKEQNIATVAQAKGERYGRGDRGRRGQI